MTLDTSHFLRELSLWALPLLLAITFHEAAHAWAALKLGDKTAYFLGRVSSNPIKHIDPIGTILVPMLLLMINSSFLFGWAKPVPINTRNLKKHSLYLALIAIAGPIANLIMAILWACVIKAMQYGLYASLPQNVGIWLVGNAQRGIVINCLLAIFNMLPIPPLDGSKILSAVLPRSWLWINDSLEDYGFIILLLLLMSGILTPIIQMANMLLIQSISSIVGLV